MQNQLNADNPELLDSFIHYRAKSFLKGVNAIEENSKSIEEMVTAYNSMDQKDMTPYNSSICEKYMVFYEILSCMSCFAQDYPTNNIKFNPFVYQYRIINYENLKFLKDSFFKGNLNFLSYVVLEKNTLMVECLKSPDQKIKALAESVYQNEFYDGIMEFQIPLLVRIKKSFCTTRIDFIIDHLIPNDPTNYFFK